MNAIIITIGDEILSGATIDTNAAYIAKGLMFIGIDVTKRCSVGDERSDIKREITQALEDCDVVITTGGLGPTDDDITKEVICEVFGERLVEHKETLAALKERYRQLGAAMSHTGKRLCMQPRGATLLYNPLGTAPGILYDRDGKVFCAMAGVPSEMEAILVHSLIPYLEKRGTGRVIRFKNISTISIPESRLAEKLSEGGFVPENVRLAFLPSYAGVVLRLRADGEDRAAVESVLNENFKRLYEIVKEHVFSTENESLLENVTSLLKKKKATIAVAESFTGGMVAKMLTDIPGSSEYFMEGVVTYSNEAKIKYLGVKETSIEQYGAVSEPVCREMAAGMRDAAGTDYALASTGTAGPGGGTEGKPVGLVYLAVADINGTTVQRRSFSGDRDIIRTRSTSVLLNMLRLKLLGK